MTEPQLEGRIARCPSCKTETPSRTGLPFFEYMGPGSPAATEYCKHCRYHRKAHERNPSHLSHVCGHFEADPNGRPTDTYYCGCRGWD